MKKVVILIVVLSVALGGCSGMSSTQQRVLSGGAIGASSGALIGWAAGSPAAGAAIGGGRFNRPGIEALYLSADPETALAGPAGEPPVSAALFFIDISLA